MRNYFDKPLDDMKFEDLQEFFDLQVEESLTLDYKRQVEPKIAETACAFANTVGGYIIVGVDEVRTSNKPDRPDPDNIVGVSGNHKAAARDHIVGKTRPPVVPEIKSISLPNGNDKVVLIIQIPESLSAPHEVHLDNGPHIKFRRADTTVDIGIDEVERLIARRNSQGGSPYQPMLPSEGRLYLWMGRRAPDSRIGPEPASGYPVILTAIRPRRIPDFRFIFNHSMDVRLRELANISQVIEDDSEAIPSSSGLTLGKRDADGYKQKVVIHEDGLIHCGQVIFGEQLSYGDNPTWRFDFDTALGAIAHMLMFAARAQSLVRPVGEMEVLVALHNIHEHELIHISWHAAPDTVDGSGRQAVCRVLIGASQNSSEMHSWHITVNSDGSIQGFEEAMIEIARWVSRVFGASVKEQLLSAKARRSVPDSPSAYTS